jgi:hypothetical protein
VARLALPFRMYGANHASKPRETRGLDGGIVTRRTDDARRRALPQPCMAFPGLSQHHLDAIAASISGELISIQPRQRAFPTLTLTAGGPTRPLPQAHIVLAFSALGLGVAAPVRPRICAFAASSTAWHCGPTL